MDFRNPSFLAMIGLIAACSAGNLEERPSHLRQLVKSLDIQVQPSTSLESPEFCRRILLVLTDKSRKSMLPRVTSESFNGAALAPYSNYCPRFDLRRYEAPPHGLEYLATETFRIFELEDNVSSLDGETHFILFAQSYFNSFEKEQFRSYPKIYPYAGFAWPDGNGGGAIYSIVNQARCSFEIQLVVHGEFDHVTAKPTAHFSEPIVVDDKLYIYDFHNYRDATHQYAGLTLWEFDSSWQPRQACVYDSADSRTQLSKAIGSPNNALEQTRDE
jgi:hypothetical protein